LELIAGLDGPCQAAPAAIIRGQKPMEAIIFDASEGEVFGSGPNRMRFLAQSPDQEIAITDSTLPPGFPGPVRHRHARMTDIFYVLEGTLTLHLEEGPRELGPGGFAIVPPGVVHTFSNAGPVPMRFLNIYQPAGNEHYLKEVARLMAAGRPPSPAEMAEIAARYDFEPVVDDR
jgi:quercetin dioxygenase-like cupin family protein